jgi:RHS repeat-associated protein
MLGASGDQAKAHPGTPVEGAHVFCSVRVSTLPKDNAPSPENFTYWARCRGVDTFAFTNTDNNLVVQVQRYNATKTVRSSTGFGCGAIPNSCVTRSPDGNKLQTTGTSTWPALSGNIAPFYEYNLAPQACCVGSTGSHANIYANRVGRSGAVCATDTTQEFGADCSTSTSVDQFIEHVIFADIGDGFPPYPNSDGTMPNVVSDSQARGFCGGTSDIARNLRDCAADPVNTTTGAFVHEDTDVQLSGKGPQFELTRSYTSTDSTSTSLGPAWAHSYAEYLTSSAGTVTVHSGTGQTVMFQRRAGGSYSAPGANDTLQTAGSGFELVKHDKAKHIFDSSGRLTRIEDPNGLALTFSYTSGRLAEATDASGRSTTFTYNGSGLLERVTLADGRHVDYTYASARLVTASDQMGKTTTYGYDSSGRLNSIINALGQEIVHNTYDGSGRVQEQADALGKISTFSYAFDAATDLFTTSMTDARGKTWTVQSRYNVLEEKTDPLGNVTTYEWDSSLSPGVIPKTGGSAWALTWDTNGNLLSKTAAAPFNYSETYVYNAQNRPTSHTDANGETTTYGYDTAGNLTSIVEPGGATTTIVRHPSTALPTSIIDARGKTWTYAYDAAGHLVSSTTPLGHETTMTYDSRGFMTSRTDARGNEPGADPDDFTTTYTYDDAGHVLTTTDPLGGVTTNVYDDTGQLRSRTDARGKETTYAYNAAGELTETTAPDGGLTTYTYDDSGHLLTETDAEGGVTSYAYDDAGRMGSKTDPRGKTTTYAYDAAGNLTSQTTPLGHETTHSYDVFGRRTAIVDPSGNEPGADPADFTTTYAYDAKGNVVSETDPLGNATERTYDHKGRVLTTTDAAGKVTTFTYDGTGNQLTETDPLSRTTMSEYDDDGRLATRTDPRGKATTFSYDAADNLVSTVSPLGHETTSTFDALNRVTARVDPRGNEPGADPLDFTTSFDHDAAGNVVTATDALGHETTYTYDDAGNRASKTDGNGHTTSYSYDRLGRLESLAAPDGAVTSYGYDAAGNILTRTDDNEHTTSFTYDGDGHQTSETTPLGHTRTFAYDAAGNATSEIDPRGNATPTVGDYAISRMYDANGRLTAIDYSDSTPDVGYGYDARGLRTTMTDGAGTETRSYDDAGRLLSVARGASTLSYGYDAASNITRRTYPSGAVVDYGFDDDGRLETVTDGMDVSTYTYDASGRPATLARPNGTSSIWTYDAVGRTATITHRKDAAPFASYAYTYDSAGNPTTVVAPEGTSAYGYDAQDRLTDACYDAACQTDFLHYTYDGVGNRLTEERSRSAVVAQRAVTTARTATTGASTLQITKPSSTQAGDVMILHVAATGSAVTTESIDGSWTPVSGGSATAAQIRGSTYFKVADGSPATYTITFSSPMVAAATIASYSGVDVVSPIEDNRTKVTLASTTATVDPVSASGGGRVLGILAVNATGGSGLFSGPDEWYASGGPTGAASTTNKATAKAVTETGSVTPTGASYSVPVNWVAQLIALRPGTGTTTYTYAADDELTSATSPRGTTDYSYDAAGNETAAGTRALSYDLAGRTTQIADPGITSMYAYDGDGKRLSTYDGTSTTNAVWDPNGSLTQLIEETDGVGALVRRYDFGDKLLSASTPTSTSWYGNDALGTVTSVTDASGAVDWAYTYEGFGAQRSATQVDSAAPTQPVRFAGQYLDGTGLYHLRARQYDSSLGRMTARDPLPPIVDERTMSTYAYADGRPGVLVDPTGERGKPANDGFCGLIFDRKPSTGAAGVMAPPRPAPPIEATPAAPAGGAVVAAGQLAVAAGAGVALGCAAVHYDPLGYRELLEELAGGVYDATTTNDESHRLSIYRGMRQKATNPGAFRYDEGEPPGVSFFELWNLPSDYSVKLELPIESPRDPRIPGTVATVPDIPVCVAINTPHQNVPPGPGHWTVKCAGGEEGTQTALSLYAKAHRERFSAHGGGDG